MNISKEIILVKSVQIITIITIFTPFHLALCRQFCGENLFRQQENTPNLFGGAKEIPSRKRKEEEERREEGEGEEEEKEKPVFNKVEVGTCLLVIVHQLQIHSRWQTLSVEMFGIG